MPKRKYGSYKKSRKYQKTSGSSYKPNYYGRSSTQSYMLGGGRYRRVGLYGRFYGSGGSRFGPELKYFDQNIPATNIASKATGTLVSTLNLIPQGNGVQQMIGSKAVIKKIQFRITISKSYDIALSAAQLCNTVTWRMILVQDKQCNGVAAGWNTVMENSNLNSFPNMENSARFNIIKEWKGTLTNEIMFDPQTTSALVPFTSGFRDTNKWWNKKCYIPLEFAPQAGASRVINEVKMNNLTLLFATDAPVDESDMITVSGRYRIRYQDF